MIISMTMIDRKAIDLLSFKTISIALFDGESIVHEMIEHATHAYVTSHGLMIAPSLLEPQHPYHPLRRCYWRNHRHRC